MASGLPGMLFGAMGSVVEGNSKADQANQQALISYDNAQLSRQQGAEEERRVRIMGRKVLGSAKASYAASGVTREGSALDVLEESAANAEMDALQVRHKGELEAWKHTQEAGMAITAGSNAKMAGYIGAASSLLKGAGSAIGNMPDMKASTYA